MLGPLVYWSYRKQNGYGFLLTEIPPERDLTKAVIRIDGSGHRFPHSTTAVQTYYKDVKDKYHDVITGLKGYWINEYRYVTLSEISYLYLRCKLTSRQVSFAKTQVLAKE